MLWYSTNIFSSPLLIGSESVSMRSCQNKFVWNFTHFWKDLFNIWMLWYSTNIFSSPLLIGSESVSMRSCQNKFVWNFTHFGKDLFNIWMLWYSTNIFRWFILIRSGSVSMRICQNKSVWNFTHFWHQTWMKRSDQHLNTMIFNKYFHSRRNDLLNCLLLWCILEMNLANILSLYFTNIVSTLTLRNNNNGISKTMTNQIYIKLYTLFYNASWFPHMCTI